MGTLLPGVARELGLPEGVVVSPGGGDNAMAALGAGAVEEGVWVLSLGTSGEGRRGSLECTGAAPLRQLFPPLPPSQR